MKTRKLPVPKRPQPAQPDVSRPSWMLPCLLIALAVLAVYVQTFGYGFVSYDDGTYVYQNPIVKAGLSLSSLAWAFTTFSASNWHPLTWISFLLDSTLFGLNPAAEHAVNVFLHLASSILLFLTLDRMTKRRWPSALVAAIFALHPLHVESVAWIAERKDVLSTFFEMLTLWFYVRYTEDSKPLRYALMAAAFALSLLSKPMAVTLPFVMILLDLWPLRRRRPLWEKVPLFAMSAAAGILTLFAQKNTGAMMTLARMSFSDRIANALVDYLRYLGKASWPTNLAVLYPLQQPSALAISAAALILVAITLAAIFSFRRRPYVLVGWLWFLGMLMPVIGLVQVGFQSIADRYTYLPLVGLSIALIWTLADFVDTRPQLRQPFTIVASVALLILAIASYRQTQYWKDSIALFEHTLAVTSGNYIIHNNLGIDLQSTGRLDEAAEQFRQAVAAKPDYKDALNSLGALVAYRGNKTEAIALHRRAIASDPNYASAHLNLGHELQDAGQTQEAFAELTAGLRLDPTSARGHAYLGALLVTQGNFEEARQHLQYSLSLAPQNADAQSNLCYALQGSGHSVQAVDACKTALRMRPSLATVQLNLGNALAATGQKGAAAAMFSRMLAVNPNNAAARAALANLR